MQLVFCVSPSCLSLSVNRCGSANCPATRRTQTCTVTRTTPTASPPLHPSTVELSLTYVYSHTHSSCFPVYIHDLKDRTLIETLRQACHWMWPSSRHLVPRFRRVESIAKLWFVNQSGSARIVAPNGGLPDKIPCQAGRKVLKYSLEQHTRHPAQSEGVGARGWSLSSSSAAGVLWSTPLCGLGGREAEVG